jgi:hypothetical protein
MTMNGHAVRFGLFALILALATFPAAAGGGWLDKGKELLKSVTGKSAAEPTVGEVAGAFKEALRIGAGNVVSKLGVEDGFNRDPAVHIPLPEKLQTVKKALSTVGMSGMVDDLELRLNRAAEAATPKAKAIFVDAINQMTFDDVMEIYKGPEDSATRYFQSKMTPALKTEMQPVVEQSLAQVGAIQSWEKVRERYSALPFVPDVKADLTDHVVQKGMDGIFHYLAQEEAAIRQDPARRTTELLRKVFGKQ